MSQFLAARSLARSTALVLLMWGVVAPGLMGQPAALRAELFGALADDEFGSSLGVLGDVDGDGRPDVVVGAPFDSTAGPDAGRVWIFSADGSVIRSVAGQPGDVLGHSVAGAGDVNGDGVPDVIAGMIDAGGNNTFVGGALLLSGADGSILRTFLGGGPGEWLGWSCRGAGDVNADGYADVIVGAPGAWNSVLFAGYARVYSGLDGSLLHHFQGENGGDRFGYHVAGIGDVNTDGFDDLLVGAIGHDGPGSNAGRAYVYSGQTGALLFVLDGDAAGDHLGHSVGDAGDLNADGRPDFLVSANTGPSLSYVRIHSGVDASVLLELTGLGDFGHGAARAGDVNGDGVEDYAVGMPSDGAVTVGAGALSIFCGATGILLATHYGKGSFQRFGYVVGGGADVNGDGLSDVIVGSSYRNGNPGYAQILSTAAAAPYGHETSATQTLALQWIPGHPGTVSYGLASVSGAAPGALGIAAISFADSPPATLFGVTVLIDLTPGLWFFGIMAYDNNGVFNLPLNLRVPAAAGTRLFLQFLEVNTPAPEGVFASNGLELFFGK